MDLALTEEQVMLQDSVQRFISDNYGFEARQALARSEEGFSRQNWAQYAELGWLALPFAEAVGGFGGTPVETMILLEAFGEGLVLEPYLSTIVLSGHLLQSAQTEAFNQVLTDIMEGRHLAALAFVESQARFDLANVITTAEADGSGYRLRGSKGVVLGGPSADSFIVPARTAGEQTDARGISLFHVDAGSQGISRRDYTTIDAFRASELTLDGVFVSRDSVIGEVDDGFRLLEDAIDQGILAVGSEAVGGMGVLYKDTVAYCKTREQFGQPIGSFQVLQHRMVDMFIEHEQAESLMYMAAIRLADKNTSEEAARAARKAVSAFKVQVGKGGRFVGQNAVQLHGGMGMTDELNIGHYFKRLTAIETLFGNVDYHLSRYGAQG